MLFAAPSVATVIFLLTFAGVAALYFALIATRQTTPVRLRDPGAGGPQPAPARLSRVSAGWSVPGGSTLVIWVRRLEAIERTKYVVRKARSALILAGFDESEQLALYLVARILTPVLMVATAMAFAEDYPRWRGVAILGGAVVGYLLPDYVLGKLTQRRKRKILHELPVMIDLLVVTLEAGIGLMEAVRIVGRETSRQGMVLGKELSIAGAEMSAGVLLDDSLRNLAERTGVDDVKAVGAVLIQSKEIGGRIAPALRAAAELLTTKRRLRAEEAAQRSSIKMLVPLVLLVLPAMMIIILGPAVMQIFELLMGA
jgi:tight adherence protein C